MYISNVYLENFRNFKLINIPLSKVSFVIGGNDVGKTNLLDAVNLMLYNDKTNTYSRRLSIYDINIGAIESFKKIIIENYEDIKRNENNWSQRVLEHTPSVSIELTFLADQNNYYEIGLLNDWLHGDEEEICYKIKYVFSVNKIDHFLTSIKDYVLSCKDVNELYNYKMSTKYFDYQITSSNNQKQINFQKYKNFIANIIYANRDTFSNDENLSSISTISKIISNSMIDEERSKVEKDYQEFFCKIKNYDSFKNIFNYLKEQKIKNVENFINNLTLVPNANKYQNILSNISISYGEEMLFQKGLGTRNLIFILTLYSYFKRSEERFNFVAVEEPESHLSTENCKLVIDFLNKTITNEEMKENKLTQLVITSHSNQIINKLGLKDITVLCSNEKSIKLNDIDDNLVKYLSKRMNFDILKLLFSSNIILVEGITEELFIKALLDKNKDKTYNIDVISIGQRGFTKFLDIWLQLHSNDSKYKIAVIRDFDNLPNAKSDHDKYEKLNSNIKISTTINYTFEDDLVKENNNLIELNKFFKSSRFESEMIDFLKNDKAESIYVICNLIDENKIDLEIPKYIQNILNWFNI